MTWCCSIIIGGPIDGFSKTIGVRALRAPRPMIDAPTRYTEWRNGTQTRQNRIHDYQWVTGRSLRDSLSVTDSVTVARTLFEARFVDFCVKKFRHHTHRTFSNDISKRACSNFVVCRSGAPFQPGAQRTCVPCLMVNPALPTRTRDTATRTPSSGSRRSGTGIRVTTNQWERRSCTAL